MHTEEGARQFCKDAQEASIKLGAIAGVVNKLQSGAPMSESELEAAEFMGSHPFCNDGKPGLYYGAILNHKDLINELL